MMERNSDDHEGDSALARIAEIDALFEAATGWGSWMVDAARTRRQLVESLRAHGHQIDHRWETTAS